METLVGLALFLFAIDAQAGLIGIKKIQDRLASGLNVAFIGRIEKTEPANWKRGPETYDTVATVRVEEVLLGNAGDMARIYFRQKCERPDTWSTRPCGNIYLPETPPGVPNINRYKFFPLESDGKLYLSPEFGSEFIGHGGNEDILYLRKLRTEVKHFENTKTENAMAINSAAEAINPATDIFAAEKIDWGKTFFVKGFVGKVVKLRVRVGKKVWKGNLKPGSTIEGIVFLKESNIQGNEDVVVFAYKDSAKQLPRKSKWFVLHRPSQGSMQWTFNAQILDQVFSKTTPEDQAKVLDELHETSRRVKKGHCKHGNLNESYCQVLGINPEK